MYLINTLDRLFFIRADMNSRPNFGQKKDLNMYLKELD